VLGFRRRQIYASFLLESVVLSLLAARWLRDSLLFNFMSRARSVRPRLRKSLSSFA